MEVTRNCFETNYIPTNLHSFHMLHINDAQKPNKFPILLVFFRSTVRLALSSVHKTNF